MEKFEQKKALMKDVVAFINAKYGQGTATLEMKDQYYNMREQVEPKMHIIELAKMAMQKAGVVPNVKPIRGGTDGAQLSFMGLPCPNLGTGSHNHHGRFEYACCDDMELCAMTLVRICELYAAEK